MYVCVKTDGSGCAEWAQQLGMLPALSIQDAGNIGGTILIVWAIGWAFGVLFRFIINK